jgi:hypothetical protein
VLKDGSIRRTMDTEPETDETKAEWAPPDFEVIDASRSEHLVGFGADGGVADDSHS